MFLYWVLILAAALTVTRAMWVPALMWGHSAWFDLVRVVEFNAAVRAGNYWPAWSPDLYHGYGSPLFQFYAPLVYFITELPLLAGMDIASAMKVTQLLALIASGLAMYHFASQYVSQRAACFGAVLYMVAPYRFVDLYMRHALAEHAALLWLPLIVWGTERFTTQNSRAGLVTGVISSAGIVLTHNVMALIGLPSCVLAGAMLSECSKVQTRLRAVIPAMLGVGIAAFFWWPAFAGRPLTQAEENLTNGHFDYHQNFLGLWNLLVPSWQYGGETNALGPISTQIGVPHLIFLISPAALFFFRRGTRLSITGAFISLGAGAMCHSLSRPAWEILPLLKYVQFPWRFLTLVVFGSSICGAALFDRVRSICPRCEAPILFAALILVMTAYFPCYSAARFLAANMQTNSLTRVGAHEVRDWQSRGALLPVDRVVTPSMIGAVGERGTSRDDFLPRGVQEEPTAAASHPLDISGGVLKQWHRTAFNKYRAEVAMANAGKIELNQFWFPGWRAFLDRHPVDITPSGKFAIVSCDVPAGEHIIEFEYSSLPQRSAGAIVSALSLMVAAGMIVGQKLRHEFSEAVAP